MHKTGLPGDSALERRGFDGDDDDDDDNEWVATTLIGILLGVLWGLLEKSEMFRLSEILGCQLEIFITYLYKNALLIIAKMF